MSDDGTVGYDPALEGVLSGKGTGRLVVKGGTVAVDATALFVPGVLVDYTSQQPTATPFSRCPTCPAVTTSRAPEAKASFFSL